MGNYYPGPDGTSGEFYGDAGAGRPDAWRTAPGPGAMPPPAAAGEGPGALPAGAAPAGAVAPYGSFGQYPPPPGQYQLPPNPYPSPPKLYAHKNEVLYAFGGLFFPGLVLLLMGGKKSTGITMLCCLLVSVILSVFLIGIPLLLGLYIWSVIACFREARRQNVAHGYES